MTTDALKYRVIIYWSDAVGTFIAEMPELPGRADDGAAQREALDNVGVIAQEWIETARDLGRTVPAPRGRLLFA